MGVLGRRTERGMLWLRGRRLMLLGWLGLRFRLSEKAWHGGSGERVLDLDERKVVDAVCGFENAVVVVAVAGSIEIVAEIAHVDVAEKQIPAAVVVVVVAIVNVVAGWSQ